MRVLEVSLGTFDLAENVDDPEKERKLETLNLLKAAFLLSPIGTSRYPGLAQTSARVIGSIYLELSRIIDGISVVDRLRSTTRTELRNARNQFRTMASFFGVQMQSSPLADILQPRIVEMIADPFSKKTVSAHAQGFLVWLFARETPFMQALSGNVLRLNPNFDDASWIENSTTH